MKQGKSDLWCDVYVDYIKLYVLDQRNGSWLGLWVVQTYFKLGFMLEMFLGVHRIKRNRNWLRNECIKFSYGLVLFEWFAPRKPRNIRLGDISFGVLRVCQERNEMVQKHACVVCKDKANKGVFVCRPKRKREERREKKNIKVVMGQDLIWAVWIQTSMNRSYSM